MAQSGRAADSEGLRPFEAEAVNQLVVGSNPTGGANIVFCVVLYVCAQACDAPIFGSKYVHLAQAWCGMQPMAAYMGVKRFSIFVGFRFVG